LKSTLETPEGQFTLVRIIQFAMLMAAPLVYLPVVWVIGENAVAREDFSPFVLYLLLIVGTIQPIVCPLIEKMQLVNHRNRNINRKSAAALYVSMVIVRTAFVEAIYIYGLVAFLLSNQLVNMLYFYPVGMIWTAIYWVRRERFERFVSLLEST